MLNNTIKFYMPCFKGLNSLTNKDNQTIKNSQNLSFKSNDDSFEMLTIEDFKKMERKKEIAAEKKLDIELTNISKMLIKQDQKISCTVIKMGFKENEEKDIPYLDKLGSKLMELGNNYLARIAFLKEYECFNEDSSELQLYSLLFKIKKTYEQENNFERVDRIEKSIIEKDDDFSINQQIFDEIKEDIKLNS